MKESVDREEGPRSFSAFLRQVDGGSFESELASELHKMNEELQQIASSTMSKAKGELTIVLRFSHLPNGQVDINTDLKTKLPKIQRARSVFWVTRGFNLTPTNPRQESLNFRDVNQASAPAREVEQPARAARSV